MTYTIPHTFHQGLKASAVEVNENFTYILEALQNISSQKIEFCVNAGHRNAQGLPDLIRTNGTNISIDQSAELMVTDGNSDNYRITNTLAPVVPTRQILAQIIPQLSDYTDGAFTIASSSEMVSHPVWHLADGSSATYYQSEAGVTNVTITMSYTTAKSVCAYLFERQDTTQAITELQFTGVNTTNNYSVILHKATSSELATLNIEQHKWKLPVAGNFDQYKLKIAFSGNSLILTSLKLFSLNEATETASYWDVQKQYVYANAENLFATSAKVIRQISEPALQGYYSSIIQSLMSSNSSGGVVLTPSSEVSTHEAYKAMDGNSATYWQPSSSENAEYKIQLSGAVKIAACKIQATTTLSNFQGSMNGKLQGSADGSSWTTIYEFNKTEWSSLGQTQYFYFEESANYTYFRLLGNIKSMAEFTLYAKETAGQLFLGQASEGDIWFSPVEPFSAKELVSGAWVSTTKVPLGEYNLTELSAVQDVVTYDYNQNGITITSQTPAVQAGNILTKDAFEFTAETSGYLLIPAAHNKTLILQWGRTLGSTNTLFPIAFPNSVFSLTATAATTSCGVSANISVLSNSAFQIINGRGTTELENLYNHWIAIGW